MRKSVNWIKHVYIDESGDLGKYGSRYFTIAAVIADQPKTLSRIMKRLRERKLKKKLRQLPEIKANNSNKEIREYVLDKVKNSNCKIFAIVVEKSKVYDYLFNAKDKLYNYLCGRLLSKLDVKTGKLLITIDKKHTNTFFREDFDTYLKNRAAKLSGNLEIEIRHLPSYSSNELQVADFVVWSINRKFNFGDESYFRIIAGNIVNKEEIILWKQS